MSIRNLDKSYKVKTALGDEPRSVGAESEDFLHVWVQTKEGADVWDDRFFDLKSVKALIDEMKRVGIPTDEIEKNYLDFEGILNGTID